MKYFLFYLLAILCVVSHAKQHQPKHTFKAADKKKAGAAELKKVSAGKAPVVSPLAIGLLKKMSGHSQIAAARSADQLKVLPKKTWQNALKICQKYQKAAQLIHANDLDGHKKATKKTKKAWKAKLHADKDQLKSAHACLKFAEGAANAFKAKNAKNWRKAKYELAGAIYGLIKSHYYAHKASYEQAEALTLLQKSLRGKKVAALVKAMIKKQKKNAALHFKPMNDSEAFYKKSKAKAAVVWVMLGMLIFSILGLAAFHLCFKEKKEEECCDGQEYAPADGTINE